VFGCVQAPFATLLAVVAVVVVVVEEEAVALYQFSVLAVIAAAHGVSAVTGILQALPEVALLLEVLNLALLRAETIQQAAKIKNLRLRLADQGLHHNHQPAPAALAQV